MASSSVSSIEVGGVLRGIHHGAAAIRHVVDGGIHIVAGLLVAAARLLLAEPAKVLSASVIWSVEGGDIVFHGCYILLEAFSVALSVSFSSRFRHLVDIRSSWLFG